MSHEGPHTDPLLESHFGGFQPLPPDGAWERIAATMDRNRKRRLLYWWSGVAASLIWVCSMFYWLPPVLQRAAQPKQAHHTEPEKSVKSDYNPHPPQRPELREQARLQPLKPLPNTSTIPFSTIPAKDPAPAAEKQSEALAQGVAVDDLTIGFGMSGKDITLLRTVSSQPHATLLSFKAPPVGHRLRVAAPALDLGLVFNPSLQAMQLRLASAWANYVHEDYLGIRQNQETPLEAMQAGVELALRLRHGIIVNSGIWLAQQGIRQDYHYAINKLPFYRGGTADLFGNRLIEGYLIDPTPETVDYSGSSRLQFIQIPLQAGYERPLGLRGGIRMQAGAAAAFLLSQSGLSINYSNLSLADNSNSWIRNSRWTALGSLSYFRQLSPMLRLGIGIRMERSLNSQYKEGAPLIGKNSSSGILFNLNYRIY